MKKISKLVSVILAGAMLLSVAGCGKNNDPKTAGTDNTKKLTVAVVQPMDHPSLNQIRETIISEIDTMGLSDQVKIVEKNANSDATLLPSIMQSLVSDNVDMIVPIATNTAQAAAAATTEIPIVFSAVSNPIEAGLVTSFDDTSKNITGVSNSIAIEDIFKLAKELTPEVKTFGFVYNTSEINSATGIQRAKAYCDANGIAYKEATISSAADIQQAALSIAFNVDAFFTPNDNTVASAMPTYLQVALDAGLPLYVGADSMVNDGGLATVGIDYTVLGKQTAQMIKRILIDKQTVSENHVEAINQYAKMINTTTASKLNIQIPDTLKNEFVTVE